MILEGDSDIIQTCEWCPEKHIQFLHFRNGSVLAISQGALAYYKSLDSVSDPLGNGLVDMVELTEPLFATDQGFVEAFRAGFVGLHQERVILITPNDIQLFENKDDALRNQNEIARLSLN